MTLPGKPPLGVYLLRHEDPDLAVFRALALALGLTPEYARITIDGERHAIRLRGDVHRDHNIAVAVLRVDDRAGVDLETRLAALHARREGVHRFILLLDSIASPHHADDLERDARLLLDDLGASGNDTPVVRAALSRTAGAPDPATRAAARDLLAALDDLPPFLAPSPLLTTPPGFAAEAAILELLRPHIAPATRIEQVRATVDETAALRAGAGGSFLGGATYLDRDEAWPVCPQHRRPLGGMLQVDARDALHGAPPAHGVFTVFTCPTLGCDASEVRHHPMPRRERRRTAPPEGAVHCTDRPTILRPDDRCFLLPDDEVFVRDHHDLSAHLCALTRDDDPMAAQARCAAALGLGSLRVAAHLGGWHHTDVGIPAPTCDVCHARCILVVQVDAGDDQRCLWACRDHPSAAHHAVHP